MTQTVAPAFDKCTWQPLLELATREVFEMMIGSGVEHRTESPNETLEVTAMVGLAGQLRGLLIVRGSAPAAATIASRMLGLSAEEAEASSQDAFGEVCNMIAGNFKSKLSGTGNHCMLSVPTVITGADYEMYSRADGEKIDHSFSFDEFPMRVTLELHP